MLLLYNIANIAQRTFEIVQKLRSREHGDIDSIARTQVSRLLRARYRVTFQESWQLILCTIMASSGKLTACLMVTLRFRLDLVTAKPLAHSTAR